MADRVDDDGLRLQAHHSAWSTLWSTGELVEAQRHIEAGRHLYDAERHRSHRTIFGGHDPGVCSYVTGGITEWLLGYPTKARWSISQALAIAEQIKHPYSSVIALEFAALVHLNCSEAELAQPLAVAAEALRVEQRLSSVFGPGLLLGAVELMRGATMDAIAHLREALAQAQAAGTRGGPYGQCLLAEALAHQGRHEEALAILSEAFGRIEATNHRDWEAELHRVKGLVLMAQGQLDEGQALLERAIQIAREQQAKSLELRAVTSLTRVWGERGRRAEARNLLAPVYGWFAEGFDTADLKQAKALLDALA